MILVAWVVVVVVDVVVGGCGAGNGGESRRLHWSVTGCVGGGQVCVVEAVGAGC